MVAVVALLGRAEDPGSPEGAPGLPGEELDGLRGAVTHVRDGDTIEVGDVAVRIANLDCAERGTAEGQAASRRMAELVAGEAVACALEGRRSYDREVGTCALGQTGADLGETLIAEGVCGRWR